MRWVVTLEGEQADIARLVENLPDLVDPVEGEPLRAVVTLDDPEGGLTGDDGQMEAREAIERLVARINGVAKLRWGRAFGGVESVANTAFRSDGTEGRVVFAGVAKLYLTHEDAVRFAKSQGWQPPIEPVGLVDINNVAIPAVVSLAAGDAAAARVFRLLDLALSGQHDIDWVLVYATLEAVRADATSRGANGNKLGWWTRREWSDFTATANSPLALGVRARHGAAKNAVPVPRMSELDASWFVRRVVARWAAWRVASHPGVASSEEEAF